MLVYVNEVCLLQIADLGLSDELTSTKTGDGKCSYRWAAPEIFARSPENTKLIKSVKSDIWSLGAFVWEIWINKLPFSNLESTGHELILQIIMNVGGQKMVSMDTYFTLVEISRFYCFGFD